MPSLPLLRNLAAAGFLAGLAVPALAAPTVYFGLDNANLSAGGARPNASAAAAQFALAAGSLAVQNFDGLALGAVPASIAIGGVTASFTNSASSYSQISAGVGTFSTFPISGNQYLESLSGQGSTYFSFGFDRGVSALGFYLTDPSDWAGSGGSLPGLTLNLLRGSDVLSVDLLQGLDATQVVNGNVLFFGVVDSADPFTGFSISSSASLPDEDAIGLDDLQLAVARRASVPEPAPLVLLAMAFLAAAVQGRRRN
ncbi:MAG: hypothetical protein KA603_01710 [Azonexus sp.]|nr:hypothetical protein [Betaproteobacteria bacterium]MBK8919595.1 hypothetical protein [Betaproteobacteria bacterium]MBP6034836.1 hypothetical protein [Azonexus sp.]MBP6905542.1 hypothetical protein [Azonexus sp.]